MFQDFAVQSLQNDPFNSVQTGWSDGPGLANGKHSKDVFICQNRPINSVISKPECTKLFGIASKLPTLLSEFEELEESILQIGTLHLRTSSNKWKAL